MTHLPPAQRPRRVLIVSADIGEGHNATGRAVQDRIRSLWPDCDVAWVDTLQAMGPGVGPLFRWIYVQNVESTPWLYNLFYDALWRYRWFADGSRRFVGAWSGRRMRSLIRRYQPDLIVSTYPMGTAGLAWLRRDGELGIPVAAIVSDFAPHPFWVYSEIDQHYVMSQASLRALYEAQPDAVGAVSVPPVLPEFKPADKQQCRRALGLVEHGFHVLISCGSFGFGSVERAVDAALESTGVECVVVACGRNTQLRQRLAERAESDGRLVPLGWIEDMATLTAASDVVVTNAGGATALEGLACGRAVLMFEPIAGHGRGNAELMAQAGLAQLCQSRAELAATLHRLSSEPDKLSEIEHRALEQAHSGDFTDQVAALAELPRHRGLRGVGGADALFVHSETENVPQQTGAILRLEGGRTGMAEQDWHAYLGSLISQRARTLPVLTRQLVHRRLRGPAWRHVPEVDPREHVTYQQVGDGYHRQDEVLSEFFTTPVRTDRPPWEIKVVRNDNDDSTLILAKLHHALADGVGVTGTLIRLFQDEETSSAVPARSTISRAGSARARTSFTWQQRLRRVRSFGRGLLDLGAGGTAPPSGLEGRSSSGRRFGWVELPSAKVRASARGHRVRSGVLLVTVIAEAMHRLLDDLTGTRHEQHIRAMIPRTMRSLHVPGERDMPGNHTVALSVDLPVGPMTPLQRMSAVAEQLDDTQRGGQLVATSTVMTAIGMLPPPLQSWLVRRIYQRRFFNVIVSALPGAPRAPRMNGGHVTGVLPVLPLANGIGLSVGAITWADMVGVGITVDARLGSASQQLADHLRAAFDDLQVPAQGAHDP